MLKTEKILINGKEFIKSFSDKNKYIKQIPTGVMYVEAIDVAPSKYIYEESGIDVELYNNINLV